MSALLQTPEATERTYFRFLIEHGGNWRWGQGWRTPERLERIALEREVIEGNGFEPAFIMLSGVIDFCRREKIPYGPGRGSVGGSLIAYLLGITEVDPLEWGLYFERFLNPSRVSFPDVDLDFSQARRGEVLDFIRNTYTRDGQIVLQVGAFVRAGARATIDAMLAAYSGTDPQAGATATMLKKCLPEGNVTGGVKVPKEIEWWLEGQGAYGNRDEFRALAEQAGWLDNMLKLDGMYTHVSKHAAGVVILREEDLPFLPRTTVVNSSDGKRTEVTGYDMYALDSLKYLKWDILGLRTLDVICDAHRLAGFSGEMPDLIQEWIEHRDDPDVYEVFQQADTLGIFQMDTAGYQRTLRDFSPETFEHLIQLVALYRPGALDYTRPEDGKNMVQVFIERRHRREMPSYADERLKPILGDTHGILLYQEQQMRVVQAIAGFTLAEADALRKAIGKKRPEEMAKLLPLWEKGTADLSESVAEQIWKNIEAAARYSWNKAHAVEYAIITWLTGYLKKRQPAAFYCAEINSWQDKKEKQAYTIADARQHVQFQPPDINVAMDRFSLDETKTDIVFGLNGIKGMGESYRNAILIERAIGGPFSGFEEFCMRLPSLPMNIKLALIKCGAFDRLEDRRYLLTRVPKPKSEKIWTVAEHLNHNRNLKKPRPMSPLDAAAGEIPSDGDLAQGEVDATGYYISAEPLRKVTEDLARMSPDSHVGGEVGQLRKHNDRNGNEMATLTITTPALTNQRVRIFASNWDMLRHKVAKGKQLIFRGRMDDGTFLADQCWEPGDYRHFKLVKLLGDGDTPNHSNEPFDGQAATLRAYLSAGYRVRLL